MVAGSPRILVVEDEQNEREALARVLKLEGFDVVTAENAEQALSYLDEHLDMVLSDLRMEHTSGIDLLKYWKDKKPEVPFVLLTAYGAVDSAVEAMKAGAQDYLTKPVAPDELLSTIRRSMKTRHADSIIEHLVAGQKRETGFEEIVGESPPMQDVFDRVSKAAQATSTILISGESGTGKELIAEAIHRTSPRKDGPFIAVNMAAVPENLVESELFGHVEGAFTGATNTRIGKFEAANGGTIFIDEIGDFALESQAKLLRVLETLKVTPVGGNEEKEIDVRVVTATSRDLDEMVADETFREDLYYRIRVVTISLPPLRERGGDIPLLVRHFLDELANANGRPHMQVEDDLMHFLETYSWPGNVRQLRNCLESMVVMASRTTLTRKDLPVDFVQAWEEGEANLQIPLGTTIQELERQAIEQAIEECDGNRTAAAQSLGISVRTLQRKLKAWQDEDS
jgi:DNA-binding NtrC family response regulator